MFEELSLKALSSQASIKRAGHDMNRNETPVPALHMRIINLKRCNVLDTSIMNMAT